MRRDSLGQPVFSQPLGVSGNWLSPLGYGDGVNPWRIKKLADTLDTYVLPPEAHELPPTPYNYPSWLGFESDATQTWGWVEDQYNEPIADAVIEWGWKYQTIWGMPPELFPEESAWDRITTSVDGYFQVPKPPETTHGWELSTNTPIIASSLAFHGGMGIGNVHLDAPDTTYEMERLRPYVRDSTEFQWPGAGETINYQAYNDLEVGDQIIGSGATADYSAGFNVHVSGEYWAQQGSEAHLFIERPVPDCNSAVLKSALQNRRSPRAIAVDKAPAGEQVLKLRFVQEVVALSVLPVPANTEIVVRCATAIGQFIIVDAQGRDCMAANCMATTTTLNVTALLPGPYVLQHRTATWLRSIPFIIQR